MASTSGARRAALSGIAALVIAGCGSDSEPAPQAAAAEPDPGSYPVRIEHKFGSTEITEAPQRVVTIGYGEDDFAMALGVDPIGVREFIGEYAAPQRPWAKERLAESDPKVIGVEELNFEQIAALEPDLILGVYSFITERDYETLTKIAPTVAQTDEYVDGGVPWQEELAVHGEALGQSERARELTNEVEGEFGRVRSEHPEFEGKDALLASADGDILYGYSSQDLRSRFFTDLGFRVPPEIDELAGESFYAEFSRERMRLFDQDVLIMMEGATSEGDLMEDPLFRRLDVVREGRVLFVDPDDQFAGALGFSSPLSLPYAIDGIVPQLEAAVDGDPATEPPEVR